MLVFDILHMYYEIALKLMLQNCIDDKSTCPYLNQCWQI